MRNVVRFPFTALYAVAFAAGCASNTPSVAPATRAQASSHQAIGMWTRVVAERIPVNGPSRELAAYRPLGVQSAPAAPVGATSSNWKQLATLSGAVVHDISFPSLKVGYAAAELGQIWKTTDGGNTWSDIRNSGFPYYWYGITALSEQDVVVSGFDDSNYEGIIRWSHDGGSTWTSDIILTTTGWSDRVRFASPKIGLVVDQLNIKKNEPNAAHYTTDGGQQQSDWTEVVPDPNGGWFGDEFSLLSNKHARMSGITYCASGNAGKTWSCGPAIDSVFDGPVFFFNDKAGWVGGGEISPSVAGWLHRTTDGGKTWTQRTLNSPWPIREILFVSPKLGWAAGGNIYSNVGGIYLSKDGGKTWTLDLDTSGHEIHGCDARPNGKKIQVWCAGPDSSLNSAVYTTLSP